MATRRWATGPSDPLGTALDGPEAGARHHRSRCVPCHRQRAFRSPRRRRATIVGLIGGTAEWVFAFPDRLSVTVSAADHLIDQETETLAQLLWRDVAAVHGLTGPVPPYRIVKERRATFAATPAQARGGPPREPLDQLFLAGDGSYRSAGDHRGCTALRRGCGRTCSWLRRWPAHDQREPHRRHRRRHKPRRGGAAAPAARGRAWVFELEADATIPAEYILLRQYLGEPDRYSS